MSDIENTVEAVEAVEVVKSEAEQMAEAFAQKADKADLEQFAKAEAIEAAKAETLEAVKAAQEAVKAELLEEVEAKFNQAPAFIKSEKDNNMQGYDFPAFEKGSDVQWVTKAVNNTNPGSNDSLTGSPIPATGAYADLVEANPFRAIASVIAVNGSSFNIPKLSGISANLNQAAGSFTEGSSISEQLVKVDHYNALARISMPTIDDVPGYESLIGPEMVAQLGKDEHERIVTTLDAATVTEVSTDISDGVSLTELATLYGTLPVQYRNRGSWVVNDQFWGDMLAISQSGTGSPLLFAPTGEMTLWGRPIQLSGELDSGATAGDNPVYFGDFSRGFIIGSRQDIDFRRTDGESIGHMTYWAQMRSGVAVKEAAALVRFNSVA